MERLSTLEIQAVVDAVRGQQRAPSEHDQDEMAIPSYLHGNPLIRWLMWRRLAETLRLSGIEKEPVEAALDFGCGVGVLLPTLSARAQRVHAIDLFPAFAQELVQRQRLRNVEFAKDLDAVADASLDLITATDVLEHVDEPEALAKTFRRKLKKGGRLVVSGPTESFVYKLGRAAAGFAGKGHYHHHTISELERMIVAGGPFVQLETRRLPFRLGPSLFHVTLFS